MRKEIFHLSYRLHWTYSEAMGLETGERREYVRLLVEMIEREDEAVQTAKNASKQ